MSVISKALSWWAYEPESGFSYLGGFGVQRIDNMTGGPIWSDKMYEDLHYDTPQMKRSVDTLKLQADKQATNWTCVLQSQDIRRLKHQCGPAIDYLDDLEEEHYENMRHDAERG